MGWKIGCTSPAIQQQFELEHPVCARLMEPFIYRSGVALQAGQYSDWAVEAEIVLRLARDVTTPNTEEISAAIGTVASGIELHHYTFWYGSPTSQELIASNAIHAALVVGKEIPFNSRFDLDAESMQTIINGEDRASGIGRDIQGGPLRSVAWLVCELSRRGLRLCSGDLVIPGSAVNLVRVRAGDKVEAHFKSLGRCKARLDWPA